MEQVFFYFMAIGAGLTSGIALIALPILWFINRRRRKRGESHVY